MPSFIQMASQSITIIVINNVLRTYGGDLYISTYGIVNKVVVFLTIPLQGIVQGIQPIIGYNYGARINSRVREALKYASNLAGIYGVICAVSIMFLSKLLLYPFTNDLYIIQSGSSMLKIICLATAFLGVHMIQVSYFQAIGKATTSVLLSMCNNILCLAPLLFLLSLFGGLKLIWFAFPIANLASFGISNLCVVYERRRKA